MILGTSVVCARRGRYLRRVTSAGRILQDCGLQRQQKLHAAEDEHLSTDKKGSIVLRRCGLEFLHAATWQEDEVIAAAAVAASHLDLQRGPGVRSVEGGHRGGDDGALAQDGGRPLVGGNQQE